MTARRRPAAGALVGALATGVLAGCVSVPTSGAVHEVDEPPTAASSQVNVPAGPAAGATREEIVQGFLAAMEALPVSTEVAGRFLTEAANRDWHPERQTIVFDRPTPTAAPGHRVEVRMLQIAHLTSRGSYVPDGDSDARQVFRLVRVGGQWRIADPPDALFVQRYFFEQTYKPFDLYFPDPTGTALIADPVFLPVGDELATRLVRGLLQGPTSWLGDAATSAVPPDTEVQVSVPLQPDGVADVQLSQPVTDTSDEQLQLLSAQLVWTLGQVEGIEGVRITLDGSPQPVEGAGSVQAMDAWPQFDPNGSGFRSLLYALHRGALTVVGDEAPVAGYWGSARAHIADFSVDRAVSVVGAIGPDHTRLLQGQLAAQNRADIATWYTARGRLSDPQWDRTGQLWVLDHTTQATDWVVANGSRARRVPAGALGRADVSAMSVSADGARVAAIVNDWTGPVHGGGPAPDQTVVVARVVRGADGVTVRRLDRAYAVPSNGATFTDLRDIDWGAASRVSVLADIAPQPTQPFQLAIDGSSVFGGAVTGENLLEDVGARTLAAVGVDDAPTVVGDQDGDLSVLSVDEPWATLADGLRRPHYPS